MSRRRAKLRLDRPLPSVRLVLVSSVALVTLVTVGCGGEAGSDGGTVTEAEYRAEAGALCKEWEAEDRELVQPATEAFGALETALNTQPRSFARDDLVAYFRELSGAFDSTFVVVAEQAEGELALYEELAGLEAPPDRREVTDELKAAFVKTERFYERRVRPEIADLSLAADDTAMELESARGEEETLSVITEFDERFSELDSLDERLDSLDEEITEALRANTLTSCAEALERRTDRWDEVEASL